MYIPYKSAHPRHTIKNYVTGGLKRYVRINMEENFLKTKIVFSLECVSVGSQKIGCFFGFLKVNILIMPNSSLKSQLIRVSFREREKQADPLINNLSEWFFSKQTIQESSIDSLEEAEEVVSGEEGDMVSMVALDNLDGLLFKGRSTAMYPSFYSNKWHNNPCQFDCALFPFRQRWQEDVLYFPRSTLN